MILDVIVIAILLISAGIAFFRGFIREVLTILGVVGGVVAAYFGGPLVSPVVRGMFGAEQAVKEGEEAPKLFDLIPYDTAADALAYGGVFIVVVIVLSVASHLLSGWARAIGLGAVDRTLGVIFGIARGAVILGLLYLPLHLLIEQEARAEWFKGSRSHVFVEGTAQWMTSLLPDSFKAKAGEEAEKTADSMAKATREKLQELDVLKAVTETAPSPEGQGASGAAPSSDAAAPAEAAPGYEQQQRRNMNELIQDSVND